MTRPRWDIAFIVFILLLMILAPIPIIIDTLNLQLDYSLTQLMQEPWRIISSHLIHGSWPHLLINVANIILLRLIFREWLPTKLWLSFIIFSATFISIGLWLTSTLKDYVGFSGVFHGLLLYLLLYYQDNIKHKTTRLLLIGGIALLIFKVGHEQIFGASEQLTHFIRMNIAIDAHLLGVISGLLFWLPRKMLHHRP